MSSDPEMVEKLTTLNQIAETLNRAVDVRGVLDDALADLVALMGLETGWIFLRDPAAVGRQWGSGYVLAAHHNLPPGLDLESSVAWAGGCLCQELCNGACLNQAYNEVQCSRLAGVRGDSRGLAVHASTPLRSGDRSLGILNVAAPDWTSFSPQALALLTNVGSQIGIALERARLFDLVQSRRVNEHLILLDFSNKLLSRLDLDDLMDVLVGEVLKMTRADACAVLLPGENPDLLDFWAAEGWDTDPVAESRRVPNNKRTGPGLVFHSQHPLLEEDLAAEDSTSWAPRWLRGEGFRGHAVLPLIAAGRSVGVLVIDKRQPWLPDDDELRLLLLMANQAAIAIEKARLHQQEVKAEALEQEVALGRQIQLSLLPKAPPVVSGWEFATWYQPARLVGGDFFDFFELPGRPHRLGIVIADVAGKGVPAALFMALSRTLIRGAAMTGDTPAAVLAQANRALRDDSRSDLFLTVFYGVLYTESGHLVYANAGHNRPLWLRSGTSQIEELAAPGIALGVVQDMELEERGIDMAGGDVVVAYTDGVTEAMDANNGLFDHGRLHEAVLAQAGAGARQILDATVDAVQAFVSGATQSDDLTLVVFRRCP